MVECKEYKGIFGWPGISHPTLGPGRHPSSQSHDNFAVEVETYPSLSVDQTEPPERVGTDPPICLEGEGKQHSLVHS
jgi:hypothetical protein